MPIVNRIMSGNNLLTGELRKYLHTHPVQLIFSGASSIGKTTMAKLISKNLQIPWLPEHARIIIKKNRWKRCDIEKPACFNRLQELIIKEQVKAEKLHLSISHCSDISIFDPIIYSKTYKFAGKPDNIEKMGIYKKVDQIYKRPIFIILKPNIITIKDDGIRLMHDLRSARLFNNLLKKTLRKFNMPFIEIFSLSVLSREQEIYSKIYEKLGIQKMLQ